MAQEIRWGILGSGQIANRFAADLILVPAAKLTAVASRNFDNTNTFAEKFNITAFGSIEDLLNSPIDVVYIATPHSLHCEHALKALRANKHVLCEKPLALNAIEATEMLGVARARNLFFLEGMWTRFLPAIREVLHLANSGAIGQIQRVDANFGFAMPFDAQSRIYDLALGGGSLLDVGVYCVSFFQMLMGELQPVEIRTEAKIGRSGVDEVASWSMTYSDGTVVAGHSSVIQNTSQEAVIVGTQGTIRIPRFWCPKEFFFNDQRVCHDFVGGGFQFEAQEVIDCLAKGKLESSLMSHRDSIRTMECMDELRRRWGMRFPREKGLNAMDGIS